MRDADVRLRSRCAVCDAERSGCRQEIDDLFDGVVGAVVGGFEATVWPMLGVRPVVKAAVGERSAQALVERQQE
jgi:hypothetical protein